MDKKIKDTKGNKIIKNTKDVKTIKLYNNKIFRTFKEKEK